MSIALTEENKEYYQKVADITEYFVGMYNRGDNTFKRNEDLPKYGPRVHGAIPGDGSLLISFGNGFPYEINTPLGTLQTSGTSTGASEPINYEDIFDVVKKRLGLVKLRGTKPMVAWGLFTRQPKI